MIDILHEQGLKFAAANVRDKEELKTAILNGNVDGLQFLEIRISSKTLELLNEIPIDKIKGIVIVENDKENTKKIISKLSKSLVMIYHSSKDLDLGEIHIPKLRSFSGLDILNANMDIKVIRYLYIERIFPTGFFYSNLEKMINLKKCQFNNSSILNLNALPTEKLVEIDLYSIKNIIFLKKLFQARNIKSINIQKCRNLKLNSSDFSHLKYLKNLVLCDIDKIDSLDFVNKIPNLEFLSVVNSKFDDNDIGSIINHPNKPRFSGSPRSFLKEQLMILQDRFVW